MKGRFVLAFLVAGTAAVLIGPAGAALSLGSEPGYRATAVVGGREITAVPGTVIATGVPTGTGCRFDVPVEISGQAPDNGGAAAMEIRTHVNDTCPFVVVSVTPLTNPPQPPPAPASPDLPTTAVGAATTASGVRPAATTVVNHYGWAKHRVEEYVNIPVTYTYVEMKYKRDGSKVYGGSGGYCQPWNDGMGWTVTLEACNWDPNGPTAVFIYGRYHFSSWIPPQPSYSLSARFTADPGARFTCAVYSGTIPLGWGHICSGGLYY